MAKKHKAVICSKLKNPDIEPLINKCVDFGFDGTKLKFYLSHGLFSSFDIDAGTRMLLKTVAQNIDCSGFEKALDVGCGTGVIGIALKKRHPRLTVKCTDRDALALAFTEENAALNRTDGIVTEGQLGIEKVEEKYSLILSNIPAKIGKDPMADLVARCMASLEDRGICAVVVIAAFKDIVGEAIKTNNGTVVFNEETPRHAVFHFRSSAPASVSADYFLPYIRGEHTYVHDKTAFKMTTVQNLPDFDTMGHQSAAALMVMKEAGAGNRLLFINPGQGHVPCYTVAEKSRTIEHITLAGRDLLQLSVSRKNLVDAGMEKGRIELIHTPFIDGITGRYDLIVVFPDIIPGVHWEKDMVPGIRKFSSDRAAIVFSAKSTYVYRLLEAEPNLKIRKKIKYRGYSALLFS
ncbi:MAG: methyltransferase [Spirochaetales bacterium]|nr:methyltransferase [Spirochaetales bacterium]